MRANRPNRPRREGSKISRWRAPRACKCSALGKSLEAQAERVRRAGLCRPGREGFTLPAGAHNGWAFFFFFKSLIFNKIILRVERAETERDGNRTKRSIVTGWGQRPVRGQMMKTWGKRQK